MGDPITLNTAAAIERLLAVDTLRELIESVAEESDLKPYSEMFGNQPHLAPLGDIRDTLGRIGKDPGADATFDVSMLVGALVRVVAHQQERIEKLEASTRTGTKTKA